MKKKLFGITTLVIASLILVCCNNKNPVNSQIELSTSFDVGSHVENVLFVNEDAQLHHEFIRDHMGQFEIMAKVTQKISVKDTLKLYDIVFENDECRYEKIYAKAKVLANNFVPDKHQAQLIRMMNANCDERELLNYLDVNDCRDIFNEIFISSYIVVTQENPESPLNGIPWDWGQVGACDAIGGGTATLYAGPFAPAVGGICSASNMLGQWIGYTFF